MKQFLQALCVLGGRCGVEMEPTALTAGMGGADALSALRSAARCGLPTRLVRLKPDEIIPATLPCLLVLRGNDRACVLVRLEQEVAGVIFPETAPSVTTLPLDELTALHAGEVVFPARDELAVSGPAAAMGGLGGLADELKAEARETGWLWRSLWHYASLYRDVGVAGVCINLLALASPLFIMNVYDRVIPHNATVTLWVLAAGVGVACLADGVLRALRAWYVDLAGRNMDVVLSTVLLDRVLRARLDACAESPGELAHTLESFEQLRETLSSTTLLALLELPFVLLFIGLMAWLGGSLALVPLLAGPAMALFGLSMQRAFEASARESQTRNARRHAVLIEILSGLETVKGNLLSAPLLQRYENAVEAGARARLHGRRLGTLAAQAVHVVMALSSVALILVGAYGIAANTLSMGALVACVILLGRCLGPLAQLTGLINQWQKTRAALRLLNVIMQLPDENDGHAALPPGQPGFDLHEVTLRYAGADLPAVSNLTLRIAPGERVGIVGGMGSGKSTLSRLLMGLLRPTEGRITLGGVDLRQLAPEALRTRVGYLAQEVVLFSGSVRDNLILGLPVPDSRRLERVAEIAGVTDFTALHPQGLDMPAGDRGRLLSGGQRQSVAMARALVRDPDVLVLDEPASHLDPGAEQRLMARLQQVMNNRTLVLFTHRPAMLALVDRILVMDRGRIVLDGPRETVMQQLMVPSAPPATTPATTPTAPATPTAPTTPEVSRG